MKTYQITALACVFASWGVIGHAENSCDVLIDEKSKQRNDLIEDIQGQLQKLSVVKNCANNFDQIQQAEQDAAQRQADIDPLTTQIKTQQQQLRTLLADIQDQVKQPSAAPVETDVNAQLAERLAYREQVKTWPLRTSDQVVAISQDLKSVEDEVQALRGQIDAMADWSDRADLDQLLAQERQLSQELTDLQTRLTSLQQNRQNPEYQAAEQLQQDGPERVSALKDTVQGLLDQITTINQQISDENVNLAAANTQLGQLEQSYNAAVAQLETLKSDQANSTAGLATAQIEKNRLTPILQDLQAQETVLKANLDRMAPQAQATQAIVEQLQTGITDKSQQIAGLDAQIAQDAQQVETLQTRIDAANQAITNIRSVMGSDYTPLLDYQNINNQVFALELTIEGLDKEIDNLDMRSAGAEGKLNRFIRACKREAACKSALNL
jgi:chromosome segregation ATPase